MKLQNVTDVDIVFGDITFPPKAVIEVSSEALEPYKNNPASKHYLDSKKLVEVSESEKTTEEIKAAETAQGLANEAASKAAAEAAVAEAASKAAADKEAADKAASDKEAADKVAAEKAAAAARAKAT